MIAVAGLARLQAGQHDGLGIRRAGAAGRSIRSPPVDRVSFAAMSSPRFRRSHLPARPRHRMHHRLHRVGAARQADRGHRPRDARGLPRTPRAPTRSPNTLDYKKVAKRVIAFVGGIAVQAGGDAGAAHRDARARGIRRARGCALVDQQAGRDPRLARCRRRDRAHARRSRGGSEPRRAERHAARVRRSGQQRRAGAQSASARSESCGASFPDVRFSPWYRNRAAGFEGDDFINLVAALRHARCRCSELRRAPASHRGAVRAAARLRRAGRRAPWTSTCCSTASWSAMSRN